MATLAQFWQQESDTHKAALGAAQSSLAAAQQALVDANTRLKSDAAALDKLSADITAKRAKLATSSVPSAVVALNQEIRDLIIERRTLQGAILDDQDDAVWAQADVDAAASLVARASAKLAVADARLKSEKDAADERQSLKTQLGAAPFNTLKADATTFAAGQQVTDAKTEIDATFPVDLQKITLMRYKTRTARASQLRTSVADAEDALNTALVTKDGLSGGVAKAAVDFQRADRALRDFATTAKQRYDRAVAVMSDLQAIKNGTKTPDLLTTQEKADVAGSAGRTTAEGNVEPVDGKLNDLYTARSALDAQILTQIGADVDKLATSPTVQAKRTAVTTATGALTAAQNTAVTNGDKKTVDEWEAIVQDSTWRVLVDYYDAKAILDELSATDPAGLGPALDTAEGAYVTALGKANKAQRQSDALSDVVAARGKRLEAAATALSSRLLSAVRGDSF